MRRPHDVTPDHPARADGDAGGDRGGSDRGGRDRGGRDRPADVGRQRTRIMLHKGQNERLAEILKKIRDKSSLLCQAKGQRLLGWSLTLAETGGPNIFSLVWSSVVQLKRVRLFGCHLPHCISMNCLHLLKINMQKGLN